MVRNILSHAKTWGLAALLAANVTAAGIGLAQAQEDMIVVQLDQAKVLQLPDKTSTIIVGNPIIADVTMLKRSNKMVITGKGFGKTNLIALDSSGNSIGESTIQVVTGATGLLVQRGMERESYNCAPMCQPTVALGDAAKFMADNAAQIMGRNAASVAGPPR